MRTPTALLAALLAAACAAPRPRAGAPAPPPAAGALPAHPPAGRAPLAEAAAHLAEGRIDAAATAYAEATRREPAEPQAWLGLARVEVARARLPEARAALDRSLALRETPEALLARGRVLGRLGAADEAARDLARAAELAPAEPEPWCALAAVQAARGDDVEVRRAFEGAVAAAGRAAAVQCLWTQLVALPPDPAHPQESLDRCSRGYVALLEERWADAQREHLAGLRYAPRFQWCAIGAAEATWRAGDPTGAEVILLRTVAATPDRLAHLRADAQGRLAALRVAQGRPGEALEPVRAALAIRGERAALLETLAAACEATGDAECARDARGRLAAHGLARR